MLASKNSSNGGSFSNSFFFKSQNILGEIFEHLRPSLNTWTLLRYVRYDKHPKFVLFSCKIKRNFCFFHPIFSSFGFWYFGYELRDFLSIFFRLAHLALQYVNKDYVIFSYFHNFVAKSDQKPKTNNGMK